MINKPVAFCPLILIRLMKINGQNATTWIADVWLMNETSMGKQQPIGLVSGKISKGEWWTFMVSNLVALILHSLKKLKRMLPAHLDDDISKTGGWEQIHMGVKQFKAQDTDNQVLTDNLLQMKKFVCRCQT